ncbi:uncharacterized protein [Hyperolius riggenbachi]|uniref:uncharacterized protein isoform X2 n=1 Tax=Hyperolius riggenbachi TaxID=752182 RepID=UPI0035A37AF2
MTEEAFTKQRRASCIDHMTAPVRMDEDRSHVTEKILKLTLEIIYLLTGQDCEVVKKLSGELLASSSRLHPTDKPSNRNPPEGGKCSLSQDCTQEDPSIPHLYQGEDVITARAVVRQDTEETGDEPCKEEEIPSQISTDGSSSRNPPERCTDPLYSQDCPQEDPTNPHHYQGEDLINIKTEVKEEPEDTYVRNDVPGPQLSQDSSQEDHTTPHHYQNEELADLKIKEEETPMRSDLQSVDECGMMVTNDRMPHSSSDVTYGPQLSQDSSQEDCTTPHHHQNEELADLKIKEEETPMRSDLQSVDECGMMVTNDRMPHSFSDVTYEEAYRILYESDEQSFEESGEDSNSIYEPTDCSDDSSDSDSDSPPTKRFRAQHKERRSPSPVSLASYSHQEDNCARSQEESDAEWPSASGAQGSALRPRAQTVGGSVPQEMQNPVWSPCNMHSPVIPPFTGSPGIKVPVEHFTEIDFFQLFISDNLLESIVLETNRYAQQFISTNPTSHYSKPGLWKPTTIGQLKQFLGLILNMGLTKKLRYKSYWAKDVTHHKPLYSMIMPRTRYETLMRFLHFIDNSLCPDRNHPTFDHLFKIRPLLNHFTQKFAEVYTPSKNIVVDESLIDFTGGLGMKPFIPNKRGRHGVKLYKLSESSTGYTYRFRLYEGKDQELDPPGCPSYVGINGKTSLDLLSPLLNQGYHVYMDNFCADIPLFKHLYERQTVACGTIRASRQGFPKELAWHQLKKGETISLRSNELLALKFCGKREVCMLSTIHTEATVLVTTSTKETVRKPVCVRDHNKLMGTVDHSDQMMKPFLVMKKSIAWYKKVAIYFIQMATLNSFVIYKQAGNRGNYFRYLEAVVKALVFERGESEPPVPAHVNWRQAKSWHYLAPIPATATSQLPRKRCRVCSKKGKRRESRWTSCWVCLGGTHYSTHRLQCRR